MRWIYPLFRQLLFPMSIMVSFFLIPILQAQEKAEISTWIQKTSYDLELLNQELTRVSHGVGSKGYVYKKAEEKKNLEFAINFLNSNQPGLAISFFQAYLGLSTRDNVQESIMSFLRLGDAYALLSYQGHACDAYLQGLRQMLGLTEKNYPLMIDTIKKLYPLTNAWHTKKIKELLTAILTLPIEPKYRYEVYFWAARLAKKHNLKELALQWLANVELHEDEDSIEVKALYYQALVAISGGKLNLAKHQLKKALSQTEANEYLKNLCYLALGRIYFAENKLDMAKQWYEKVTTSDPELSQEKNVESIYLSFRMGDTEKALFQANELLSKSTYPQIKKLIPYLSLLNENPALIAQSLESSENELILLIDWLEKLRKVSPNLITQNLVTLREKTENYITPSPLVLKAQNISYELEEKRRQLDLAEQNLDQLMLIISQTDINQLRPDWVNRTKQLQNLVIKTLQVGNDLSQIDSYLYLNKLNQLDKTKLELSKKKRDVLINNRQWAKFQFKDWQDFAKVWDLSLDIREKQKSLQNLQAQLGVLTFNGEKSESKRIKNIATNLDKAFSNLNSINQNLQYLRLDSLKRLTPLMALKQLTTQYTNILMENKVLIDGYRENNQNLGQHILTVDTVRSWNKWDYLISQSFQQITLLEHDITSKTDSLLKHLYQKKTNLSKLSKMLENNVKKHSQILARISPEVYSYYLVHANNYLAQIRKWKGDLAWMQSHRIHNQRDSQSEQFQSEKEILATKLNLVHRGIKWSTPE